MMSPSRAGQPTSVTRRFLNSMSFSHLIQASLVLLTLTRIAILMRRAAPAVFFALLFPTLATAESVTATVPTGLGPIGIALNPVTNKYYVPNNTTNTVTVIDGATNTTTTVTVGAAPRGVAVNPVTNKIYVPNQNSANVTVIAYFAESDRTFRVNVTDAGMLHE